MYRNFGMIMDTQDAQTDRHTHRQTENFFYKVQVCRCLPGGGGALHQATFVNSNRNCKGRPADVGREAGGLSATRRRASVTSATWVQGQLVHKGRLVQGAPPGRPADVARGPGLQARRRASVTSVFTPPGLACRCRCWMRDEG